MLKQRNNHDFNGNTTRVNDLPLSEWEPIKNLPSRHQDEILNRTQIIEYNTGDIIFMINDDDGNDYYLLSGSIELIDQQNNQVQLLQHSGQNELETIDHNKPRIFSARVKQNCKVFVTRQTFFGTINSGRQQMHVPKLEVDEVDMESSSNWMLRMLNSSIFSGLTPASLQQIFVQLDTIQVTDGERIIQQGENGEFFYLIQHGNCAITRRSKGGDTKILTQLGPEGFFGERSILSGTPSDVGIEMLSDGILMRVPADVFNNTIKTNLNRVSVDKANALIAEGADWLDVRDASLYRQKRIKNSTNLNLDNLYTTTKDLNPNKKFVICGESESHAMATAFLLSSKGFTVCSLKTSVDEYLKLEPDKSVTTELVEELKKPAPALEITPKENAGAVLKDTRRPPERAEAPQERKINPETVSEKPAPALEITPKENAGAVLKDTRRPPERAEAPQERKINPETVSEKPAPTLEITPKENAGAVLKDTRRPPERAEAPQERKINPETVSEKPAPALEITPKENAGAVLKDTRRPPERAEAPQERKINPETVSEKPAPTLEITPKENAGAVLKDTRRPPERAEAPQERKINPETVSEKPAPALEITPKENAGAVLKDTRRPPERAEAPQERKINPETVSEKPAPALEITPKENAGAVLKDTRRPPERAEAPQERKINPETVSEKPAPAFSDEHETAAKGLFHSLEKKIQNEINTLFIKKQKELDNEINLTFQKYHLATAKLIKKKLTDLESKS